MFRFLKRHPPKDSEEREKLKKELFGYRRVSMIVNDLFMFSVGSHIVVSYLRMT